MNFKRILKELGGIEGAFEPEEISVQYLALNGLSNLDSDHPFIRFMSEIGCFQFSENVGIRNTNEALLGSLGEEFLEVNIFYSVTENSRYNIFNELRLVRDQIPSDLIPFASDGYSGDYFCIGVGKENVGQIFYFWHEWIDKPIHKVFDSFETFLNDLVVVADQSEIDGQNQNRKLSSTDELMRDFLEWEKEQNKKNKK